VFGPVASVSCYRPSVPICLGPVLAWRDTWVWSETQLVSDRRLTGSHPRSVGPAGTSGMELTGPEAVSADGE
jgi:hypothetical protein